MKDIGCYRFEHWHVLEVLPERKKRGRQNFDFLLKIACKNCGIESIRSEPETKLDKKCKICKFLPKGHAGLKTLFNRYKQQARRRNLNVNLTLLEFQEITSSSCHYCGTIPGCHSVTSNTWGNYTYNGVDRKDNDSSYSKDNCVPCCKTCNWAKAGMMYAEFLEYIKKLSTHFALAIKE